MLREWFANGVQSVCKHFQGRRRQPCHPRVSPSLQLEALEERWTPSVMRPAVVNYQVGSALHENVFVETNEGLYLKVFNGSQWQAPVNLGRPAGAGLPYGSPAAINYGTWENAFVIDSGGNLDYVFTPNGTSWTWSNLGHGANPLVTSGYSNPAVANYQVGSALHENVFAIDQKGNLNLKVYNGSAWQSWVGLGTPGVQLNQNDSPAVINYGSYENVFVTDILGSLHYAYTHDGTHWTWVKLGNDGAPAYGEPAVNNIQVGSVLHEDVFVTDSHGRLDEAYYDGSSWHWGASLGIGGVNLVGTPAVINLTVGGVVRQNVYVRDSSGNLELTYGEGTAWHTFANLGHPGSGVFTDPAVINYFSTPYENLYTYDGADLNFLGWNGSSYHPWQNLGPIN
jgi:hypothetical protein